MRFDKLLTTAQPIGNLRLPAATEMKKKKMVPFLSPLHFSTPATQPTGNIYLKIALKYVQTILPARQLLKADFMDTYGFEPVYMMCLKLACSFGLRSHNTSS